MLDVTVETHPRAGERVHDGVRLGVGGSATIAAVTAAAAGAAATVVGCVGDDLAGELIERRLTELGVVARLARAAGERTGVVVAVGDGVVAERGANALLSPADIPSQLAADAVLVSGYALLQGDSEPAARTALERADAPWIAVDAASARLLETYTPARFRDATTRATALFATEAEARVLTGQRGEAAARALAATYRLACVKLGASGAVAVLDGDLESEAVTAVEDPQPLGAGDAFAATLLVALAAGAPLHAALRRACEAGARRAAGDA